MRKGMLDSTRNPQNASATGRAILDYNLTRITHKPVYGRTMAFLGGFSAGTTFAARNELLVHLLNCSSAIIRTIGNVRAPLFLHRTPVKSSPYMCEDAKVKVHTLYFPIASGNFDK